MRYFINCDGPIVQIPVPNGKTITGKFYKKSVLPKVKTHYEKRRDATVLDVSVLSVTTPLLTSVILSKTS